MANPSQGQPKLDYLDHNIFTRYTEKQFFPRGARVMFVGKWIAALGACSIFVWALFQPLPDVYDQIDKDAEFVAAVTKQRFSDVREAMLLEREVLLHTSGKQWGKDTQATKEKSDAK